MFTWVEKLHVQRLIIYGCKTANRASVQQLLVDQHQGIDSSLTLSKFSFPEFTEILRKCNSNHPLK